MRRIALAAALVLAVSASIGASPASAQEATQSRVIYEQEIILTDDHRLLEVGEGKDVESLEQYQEDVAEERGDDPEATILDTGYGYLSNGTLRIEASSCSHVAVDYFKDSGSTIVAEFGVRWGNQDRWGGQRYTIAPGGRAGQTFRSTTTPKSYQGLMRVSGNVYRTEFAACY
ncbi:hypothetical protein FZ103_10520 [Streptomonospora sp. PA3]|uniref:hypothetical protein n=1 Tax=Streptomonospora sp. PA3 TaxID=2607326 RepID=UPI0012DF81B0|nr:hypothetical protein [Streptomonospora sp. PA3]MUL41604.1 hypothetical protein [Streptomonospora sp. PA3]